MGSHPNFFAGNFCSIKNVVGQLREKGEKVPLPAPIICQGPRQVKPLLWNCPYGLLREVPQALCEQVPSVNK